MTHGGADNRSSLLQGLVVPVPFTPLSLLDSIRSDIARGCDSLIKSGVSTRERGPQRAAEGAPLPLARIPPQPHLPLQVPCPVLRKGHSFVRNNGAAVRETCVCSLCLASPGAITDLAFAVSALAAGVTLGTLCTSCPLQHRSAALAGGGLGDMPS